MQEFDIDITTPDGTMPCFAAHPDGDGPFPAVILYMDAPGIREELRDFTRRIAGEGYFCLLPDMYYRIGKLRFNRQADPDLLFPVMFKTMEHLSNARVMDDTKGMLEYLDGHDRVRGPYGCIGYCMSGQYVVSAAGTFPTHFRAIASLYGVGIVTDREDSPHLLAPKIEGELYLGFAEVDRFVPDNVIPDLKKALDDNGVAYDCVIHPGTDHGFCFPQRPAYVEKEAEIAWQKFFDLCERRLKNA